MASPPAVPPKGSSKPRITLQIPPPQSPPAYGCYTAQRIPQNPGITIHTNPLYQANIQNFGGMPPMVQGSAVDQNGQYYNPFNQMHQNKASEFMFKQFEGMKDFTMNTAKSGLSVGEKLAFWLYNKISKWSKKWFTHIFLFLVILGFTAAGAAIFVAVEGSHEKVVNTDILSRKYEFVENLRLMSRKPHLQEDAGLWRGEALQHLDEFEVHFAQWVKQGGSDKAKKTWSFWNAMFYCGTIYTTIGESDKK